MFTGIIESIGKVKKIDWEGSNLRISIQCPFAGELKIDQSVAHNGVCLTVVAISGDVYDVVAIDETLKRSNLGKVNAGDDINLERCTKVGDRLDGHIVQGHVDTTATVTKIIPQHGSWLFYFQYENTQQVTVQKGSVCVNGISLTVVDSGEYNFSVAIIPYTFENTNFKYLRIGDMVNVEFDIIGKYVAKLLTAGKKL
jgi:riboflavin synthase